MVKKKREGGFYEQDESNTGKRGGINATWHIECGGKFYFMYHYLSA